ncbi:UDP-2,4-diacetamido-2,4,6-trideoxy-beta-L-altropyranose hydrolase [Methylophaga muralis]|uniref:UDP-2,4-diacetamido-2,4, 6-trideoxy-beta-L-altropyranose hydrolase n=1 Tax=Methylophaga muralis TaxID=291169 RepID=A0A1E3GN51_9GAMM|nr:UDP-2,4-diacetamido-2,4,6-trideoxy-beta-L-altropyranose hydrolase [Methylophaga muralis]ODN65482.1 UDP-2,4-diacetamido-2,4,6-trideoxy-beta-L-altropyranose hydrolase [Methylophaga muralis]
MKIAIRVDVSFNMGSGHFMRCLTLAEHLKVQGAFVVFISHHISETYTDMLEEKGFEFRRLDYKSKPLEVDEITHASWLGGSQHEDAKATSSVLSGEKWNWIIVDHYALDYRWESELRSSTEKIMVIDDLADRTHDCDLLLDQNLYSDMNQRYEGKILGSCRVLLGPRYALLRKQFQEARSNLQKRSDKVERVLIFFGGIDAEDYTSIAISALATISNPVFEVDVVIGSQHPNKSKIIEECSKLGYCCHVQTDNMATLIANADIAIGAGGSTIWERCALGLPTITFSVANNQKKPTNDAAQAGVIYAPEINSKLFDEIKLHFMALVGNPLLRKNLSSLGMQLVDAKGAGRVASIMCPLGIVLEEAEQKDMQSVYEWRNHSSIREVSRNSSPIEWQEHKKWFKGLLSKKNAKLLIGRLNKKDVGVIRFDFDGCRAEISIYLVPEMQNAGMGSNLLKTAENWLKSRHPEIDQIDAEVIATNGRSKHFFTNNGYTHASSTYFKRMKL